MFTLYIIHIYSTGLGYVVAQWLRHCATNWKVAGSIPEASLEFFIDIILPAAI
jgi:hypothetical protein